MPSIKKIQAPRELPGNIRASNPDDIAAALAFNQRGLFIGGCPKSGTTLLLSLLDSHPQLVVLAEESFYLEERHRYDQLPTLSDRLHYLLQKTSLRLLAQAQITNTHRVISADRRDYSRFDHQRFTKLAEAFVNQPGMNDSMFFTEVIRAYAIVLGLDWKNCVRWVEKSTSNEVQHAAMARLYPNAKLVQLVRDPRAVFASRKKHLTKNLTGKHAKAHRLVREWNRSSQEIPRLRQLPDRFMVIRYEDLVKDPRGSLQTVCKHVGIDFIEELLRPSRAGQNWQGNSAHQASFSGIDVSTVDLWRTQLDPHEVWWIELHCRKGMEIASYALETDARFSLWRWLKRLPEESWSGYLRARRVSFCQWLGLIKECRYDR